MNFQPTKLLLIDDDPIIVRLLTKLINMIFGQRMEVRALTDAVEAQRTIERELFDILVTDLEMPGVNGLEILRCAKRKNSCTQVLFITAHSTLDALHEAMEVGATDHLLKPLDRVEFMKLVEDADKRVRRSRAALAGTIAAKNQKRELAAADAN